MVAEKNQVVITSSYNHIVEISHHIQVKKASKMYIKKGDVGIAEQQKVGINAASAYKEVNWSTQEVVIFLTRECMCEAGLSNQVCLSVSQSVSYLSVCQIFF